MSYQACPNLQRRKCYPALPEQIPARPLYVNSPSQFFGNLSSSVSELLITDQGAQYFHRLSTLIYSGIPISQTSRGNANWFEKSGVREIEGGIKLRLIGRVLFDYG